MAASVCARCSRPRNDNVYTPRKRNVPSAGTASPTCGGYGDWLIFRIRDAGLREKRGPKNVPVPFAFDKVLARGRIAAIAPVSARRRQPITHRRGVADKKPMTTIRVRPTDYLRTRLQTCSLQVIR